MKIKVLICVLTLGSILLFSSGASAQEPAGMRKAELKRLDSLDLARGVQLKDQKTITDLKSEKNDSKVKAREATRVKNDADDAAKASRQAYKAERKAQKARKQADAQAKKAAKSREKSDKN